MATALRAIMAGCGGISRTWLDVIQTIPDLEMVGFVDVDLQAAQGRATEYHWHNALCAVDLEAALTQVRPDIVFDCTVPEAHHQVTLAALAHNCHVLGEKPLANSMAAAREMVAAAQKTGKLYAVIQNRRYDVNIRRLRAFLDEGWLGKITTVHSDFFIGAHFGGFREHMRHVLLLDMAIHTFDAARLISGADARAVYCREWNPAGSWYNHDASAVAIFEMTDGIVYTYRGSWCAEGLNTTWECSWRVIGTKGSLAWDGAEGFSAQVVSGTHEGTGGLRAKTADLVVPPQTEYVKAGHHAGVIRDFLHCVRTGETPETVCSDNIKSLAMVFGAIESAEAEQRVQIEDF